MDIQQLRKIISDFPKFSGDKAVKPASVCNDGFPGTFNLSYSEAEMIENFGQYLDYDKDLIYSKIQPVIRFQDWSHIANHDGHSYRYLSVFDLADIGGAIILKNGNDRENVVRFSIDSLAAFLFEKLQLDKSKIRISYFNGGNVSQVSKGKYDFNFDLPPDSTVEFWTTQGIKSDQFVADKTRDTFLALNVFGLPTPWGFRHEINYLHDGKLLDIGTLEYLFYRPISENSKLVDLRRWEHLFVISAVGLERLLMAKNNFTRVTDCAHIKPLIESALELAKYKNYQQAEILCQALRAIHKIISDCAGYDNLSQRRKEKLRTFYKAVIMCQNKLGIKLEQGYLETLLRQNARLQSFYPELETSVEKTVQEIISAEARLRADRSRKTGGVAQ